MRTVQRHLRQQSVMMAEGCLMIQELKTYLERNGYPLSICWSEDATRITGGIEYRSESDQLSGLVATLDSSTGLPIRGLFECSTPQKVISHLRKYPVAKNVQLAMAQPISTGSSPFCCLYYCTDNKFDTQSVTTKWRHVQRELQKEGIKLVGKATDGDSRFIRAMVDEMGFAAENRKQSSSFGKWLIGNEETVCIQDPTHLANKMRTRLMNPSKQLTLGKD